MLIELAVGDAYGAGFEYVDQAFIAAHNDLSCYVRHPRHDIVPGCYTDDTQMSIAIAEAVVSGDDWTPLMLAERFVAAFQRDPREGYATGFYDFLSRIPNGAQFLKEITPHSDKSGAAMRAGPIGVYPNREEVVSRATVQARLTHDTPDGIRAAVAAALMTHYFLYELGPKTRLGTYLEEHVVGHWAEPWQGKVKSKGWMSVHAAVSAIQTSSSLSDLLRRCIAFSGDVDTVATIALAAASCCREIVSDLPQNIALLLENREYGRDYLLNLDTQLLSLVQNRHARSEESGFRFYHKVVE